MEHQEHRACAGTSAVTLLAIAGFVYSVFAPADVPAGWHTVEARAPAEIGSVQPTGELK